MRLLPWYEDWHWIDGLLDEFRAQHPDIRLEKLHATQEEMTLRTLIASGDPPDVFCISYETLPGLLRAGAVAPLDEHVAARAIDLDGWFPATIAPLRQDGRLWGLPKDCTPYVLFFNEEAFAAAGVPPPQAGGVRPRASGPN